LTRLREGAFTCQAVAHAAAPNNTSPAWVLLLLERPMLVDTWD
jgi:hypothetical protein